MNIDDAIALCEEHGFTVVKPRDTKDEQLRLLWLDAIKALRMARDIAEDGGKLTVTHGKWLNPNADAVALERAGVVRMIDIIMAGAVVEREARDAAA